MPSRVIEIHVESAQRRLRLVDTKSHGAQAYVALSYCWGGDQDVKATTENIKELEKQAVYDDLPATIRDAVVVTEGLGLHFLWVDALCIVQDDAADVAREIGRMSDIFSEATVALLASRADRVYSGFLGERAIAPKSPQIRLYPTVRLPYRCPGADGRLGSVTLIPLPISSPSEPIDRRAWTMQERLLAPRVLEYGTNQTRWNCQMSTSRGGYVDGWTDRDGIDSRMKQFQPLFVHSMTAGLIKLPWEILKHSGSFSLKHWHDLVIIYIQRKMSVPTDRLPAISGIVTKISDMVADVYLAGMWRSVIRHEILWSVGLAARRHRRPDQTQAPSWSWAAISSPVEFPYLRDSEGASFELEVISITVDILNDHAPFAGVKSGELIVKGRLRRAMWMPTPGFRSIWHSPHSIERLRLSCTGSREFNDLLIATIEHDACEEGLLDLNTGPIPVFLLEVFRGYEEKSRGLVLHQHGNSTFSRLGVFSFEWVNPFYYEVEKMPILPGADHDQWDFNYHLQRYWFYFVRARGHQNCVALSMSNPLIHFEQQVENTYRPW